MAFSVAMNSKRANAIVALLIASNFAEIKGVVFKRFDARRLLILSCMASVRDLNARPSGLRRTTDSADTVHRDRTIAAGGSSLIPGSGSGPC